MEPASASATAPDEVRARAAAHLLQDAAYMVGVERKVAVLDHTVPPRLVCFTGATHLRDARRIGLFSGSFNPLTCAHVAVGTAARQQAQIDTLVWAISAVTVDKERVTRASVPDRLAQLVAFARPRRETVALVNRGLYVDQIQAVRSVAPLGARIFVVVGYDKVVQIFDPHYYQDREAALAALFASADLLVAPRDSYGAGDLARLLARPENQPYVAHVRALDVPPEHLADSSTEVRQLSAKPEAHADELARLAPPEARALIATGAYASGGIYTLRQDWLAVLLLLPRAALRRVPPLATLVAHAQSSPEVRSRLRDLRTHLSVPAVLTLLAEVDGISPAGSRLG